ncbi:MAG TPA: Lrp/AsnC family transcriptional regulator [Burkholderiaceae bacterium]
MRQIPKSLQLDAIDRSILSELQADGRLSNVELAQRVHLSPSACLRRVKQLEETGVISGYVALLNPKLVGQSGTSFTIINLATMSNALLEAFEEAVRETPEILDCFYVAGANDYLIRFAYRDAEDLERFHTEVLMRLPGVERSNSMLVLRTVKRTTSLRIDE